MSNYAQWTKFMNIIISPHKLKFDHCYEEILPFLVVLRLQNKKGSNKTILAYLNNIIYISIVRKHSNLQMPSSSSLVWTTLFQAQSKM